MSPRAEIATRMRRAAGRTNARVRRAFALGLRRNALRRAPVLERPGISVVTVTWNTAEYLAVQLDAVRRHSPEVTHVVVDNHSSDHTSEVLASFPETRVVRLPANIGHGLGLDIGILTADTEFIITLDVDAFPVSARWLDTALGPLSEGATIVGAHAHRNFVHPCFLAMRRLDYLRLDRSMCPVGRCPARGEVSRDLFMDVGEALSHIALLERGASALAWIPTTEVRGPGPIGTVYGDAVYHNWFSTQGERSYVHAAEQAWNSAVERFRA